MKKVVVVGLILMSNANYGAQNNVLTLDQVRTSYLLNSHKDTFAQNFRTNIAHKLLQGNGNKYQVEITGSSVDDVSLDGHATGYLSDVRAMLQVGVCQVGAQVNVPPGFTLEATSSAALSNLGGVQGSYHARLYRRNVARTIKPAGYVVGAAVLAGIAAAGWGVYTYIKNKKADQNKKLLTT